MQPFYAFYVTVGLVCLAILGSLAHFLSPNLRDRRKRRRNYGPVISRARRPMVRLSVDTKRA